MAVVVISLFLICFLASIIGAICGVGGGVIIKPVVDAFGLLTISQASFLSGCTVLAMSAYSTTMMVVKKEKGLEVKTAVPLGIGAAVGGVVGKVVFKLISDGSNTVAIIQSAILMALTIMIFIYTAFKSKIKTHNISNVFAFVFIGIVLGIMSSFLGIGGGPINLVVFSFFFSMDTKTAAKNSLCVILISQVASLIYSLATMSVPSFEWYFLVVMALGGIIGGIIGRILDKKMDEKMVNILFFVLNVVIALICVFNIVKYSL